MALMRDAEPTEWETEFYKQVRLAVPALQDWYHADPDGTFWMTVSYDDVIDGTMRATWRLDFDGAELVAGRSPANLNWDDGVRGRDTGMALGPPTGFTVRVRSVADAVSHAIDWFERVTEGRCARG
jgi:hypothetical protein